MAQFEEYAKNQDQEKQPIRPLDNDIVDLTKEEKSLIDSYAWDKTVMDESQTRQMRKVIERHVKAFKINDIELGCYRHYTHRLTTRPGSRLPRSKPYRVPPELKKPLMDELESMRAKGIIEPSIAPHGCPAFAVKKKAPGKYRLVLDFRQFNKLLDVPPSSFPTADELTHKMSTTHPRYISNFDMAEAFHQIALDEQSRKQVVFHTSIGSFQMNRLAMGCSESPAILNMVLIKETADLYNVFTYCDDILITSPTFEEHLRDVESLLQRFCDCGLKLSLQKSALCAPTVIFLGMELSKARIAPAREYLTKLIELKPPKTLKELRGLIGAVCWLKRFTPRYNIIIAPILKNLKAHSGKRKQAKLQWPAECQSALEELQQIFKAGPYLAFADFKLPTPLVITTDASKIGTGGMLSQMQPESDDPEEREKTPVEDYKLRIISFTGHTFSGAEMHWPIYKKRWQP